MKKILLVLLLAAVLLAIPGCFGGTGFEKKADLMPDSVSISYGQQRFKAEDDAWRGFNIGATWILK